MEKLCSKHSSANRLSTLAQAADCLAKAAVTLSEAARAAAESLSSELLDITSALDSLSEGKHGRGPNGNENEDEECTNPEDTDYYLSDNESNPEERIENTPVQPETNNARHDSVEPCSAGPITTDQLRFDPTRPPPVASVASEVETVPGLAYRLLVDHEADVLFIPTFHMYKKFINDVTATDVYTITKTTTAEITQVGQKFLEADHSILLLPETTTPAIEIDEIDSWPTLNLAEKAKYGDSDEQQRLIHQARNSILVAYSQDEELYPAGSAIMWQSQPWPGNVESFRVSVALLRPTYDQKLASLPAEMKAKAYPDWISCHGPRGHRHVKSWDATTLVKKANSFLLDVLKYQPPELEYLGSNLHACLPEVSEGFMAHNGLESAARDGVLRVKVPGSGLNHVSSLPNPEQALDTTEWTAVPPTFVPATGGSQLDLGSRDTNDQGQTNNAPTASTYARVARLDFRPRIRPAAVPTPAIDTFKSTPGYTYFTIKEEFEAIPLMCFLATTCAHNTKKAVLFFDISGCQTQYKILIERITGWRVFSQDSTESKQFSEEVASDFVKFRGPAILLVHFRIRSLPSVLKNASLGYCVYWGSTLGGFVPLVQAKNHRDSFKSRSTSIIMTIGQASKLSAVLANSDFKLHPSSPDLVHRKDSPWLSDLRAATESVLSGDSKLVKELYEAHLRTFGKGSSSLGAGEIADRINKFTARVLLTGEAVDGSIKYPTIAAATALAEAAEAVAAAAKSFISDATTAVLEPQSTEPTSTNARINAIVNYDSDSESSQTAGSLATQTKDTNNIRGGSHKDGEHSSGINGKDAAPDTNDKEYISGQLTLQGSQNNDNPSVTSQQLTTDDTTKTETITQTPPPSYRILLDDESDVLLAVCSLIRRGRKVVCYVRSSITALDVYETLLSVTQVPVHRIKSSTPQELERALAIFRQGHTSVLLFPATQSPGFKIDEPDSWVVHVGWPTNEQLYWQQITDHQAKNNVFVAYSKDRDIYASSSIILAHSQPWPHGEVLFKEVCTSLRPLFKKKLAEIPAKTKAKVYPVDLPAVTAGFVSSQKLESAVEEGVLRVKSSSGINHISSLPHAGGIPAGTLSMDDSETFSPNLNTGPASFANFGNPYISGVAPGIASGSSNPWDPMHTPPRSVSRISSITGTEAKKPLDGQEDTPILPHPPEYLVIEQEFDVIPSISRLSAEPNFKNVICYMKSLSAFEPVAGMVEKIAAKPVFSVRGNGALSNTIKDALNSPSGCIILCDMYSDRPAGLKGKSIDLTIHLGWVDHLLTYRKQIIGSTNTVVLMRREVQLPNGPELVASLGRAGVSPADSAIKRRYNRQTGDSILAAGRKQWKEFISSTTCEQAIRQAYMAWITHHYHGRHKEPEWTAVNVVMHANRHFRGVFRCGNEAGVFQERPTVSQGFVKHLGLEAAVAEGLLTVKEKLEATHPTAL
ncbi:unnamed protein product [Rhizoctonia solani]|uniref:Uncharacterized protein n=1 Tax=Rhizoctonia solani TaxID=456999 RepID=A0A8H3CP59_9AGAM|nr:unnamed protein product [Rhizoctonia solani]